MTVDREPERARRKAAVALRVGDPDLARRLRAILAALPGIELAEEDEAEVVVADGASDGRGEAGLVALADGAEAARALRAGAEAVLPRDASGADLSLAVEAVARGFALLPSEALGRLVRRGGEGTFSAEDAPALTGREAEVLALLAAGASNKQIARRLGVSVHTAKFHVASILDKLDAAGRADAVARGVRLGLLML